MLAERARQVAEEIASLRVLEQTAQDATAFRTRADQLDGPVAQLTVLCGLLAAFRERGLKADVAGVDVDGLRDKAADLAARFEADPNSVVGADGDLRFTFWPQVRRLPGAVQTALSASWQGHVRESLPPEHEALLDTLASVPTLAPQVAAIRRLYREADGLAAALPQTAESFRRVEEIAGALRTAWGTLQGGADVPSAVQSFLRAASTDGATWEHLTEEVLAWLRQRNLLGAIRISWRSRP